MTTKSVDVTQTIVVTVDESKFTPEFMVEFRAQFYGFNNLDDHIKHLAQMEARGLISSADAFVEGYGPLKDMGISFSVDHQEEEIKTA